MLVDLTKSLAITLKENVYMLVRVNTIQVHFSRALLASLSLMCE